MQNRYAMYTVWLIIAGIAVRLVLASTLGLGVDESYVVTVSRVFSLSYFEHPPLHFWIIKCAAMIFASEQHLLLRLPFIALFAGSTWLMYKVAESLFGSAAGFYAALLFNMTAVLTLMSFCLLPDGPLIFFMLAATLVLSKLLFVTDKVKSLPLWVLFGVLTGLAMLSKYHGIFLFFGLFVFALSAKKWRFLFGLPGPYLAVVAAILVFSPVLIWNAQHQWISFAFQGSRGAASVFSPLQFLGNIAAQAGYILPWIWLPLVIVMIQGLFGRAENDSTGVVIADKTRFLCYLAIGPIVIFTLPTLWGGTGLPHWQVPGYLMLFPLAGNWVVGKIASGKTWVKKWLILSGIFLCLVCGFIISQVSSGWINQAEPQWFVNGDPTQEILDWIELPTAIEERGFISKYNVSFIVTTGWVEAGKVGYIMHNKIPVLCFSQSPHQFAFMYRQADFIGKNALIIVSDTEASEVLKVLKASFAELRPAGTVSIFSGRLVPKKLSVIIGNDYKGYVLPFGNNR